MTPLFIISVTLFSQTTPAPQLKPLPGKQEEIRKFHPKKVKGMPAETRLKGYDQRLKMEQESVFGGLKWRSVGPEYQSGRVVDIDVPGGQKGTMYASFATGGLWRTEDAGISWTSLFDNESAYAIGDVALSRDGKTIWLGTGENNNQRTSYSGTGVFKSTDRGATWKNMGLAESHRIGRIVIDPRNENVVYVAAIGSLYSQNPERGVYKTTDGGKTWSHVLTIDDQTGSIDLILDPKNPDCLLTAAYDRDRRAWNYRESGPGSAIYRTENAGRTWNQITAGIASGEAMGRCGLAYAPSAPNVVYAFLDNQAGDPDTLYRDERQPSGVLTIRRFKFLDADQFSSIKKEILERFVSRNFPEGTKTEDLLTGLKDKKLTMADLEAMIEKRNPEAFRQSQLQAELYRSENFGKTWTKVSDPIGDHGNYYTGRVIVNPKDSNDVVILGTIVLRSKDGGKTWKSFANEVHVDHHAFWFDPENPAHIASGNDGGLYESYDDGKHWNHLNSMAVGQFTTIAVDNKSPYNIMGGLQDNGTLMGPSNYRLGSQGQPFVKGWQTVGWGDGSAVAFDPREDSDLIYTASQFGEHQARNMKTNQSWRVRAEPKKGEAPLRYNWVSPILISPHHSDIVYLGANRLYRSLNQGKKWEPLSDDLTKNRPNGNVPFSTIKDVSESPFKFGLIYVGCDDGTMKMTKDHGATWIDIQTPQPEKWVSRVVASKWDAGTVYVSQSGYREDDFSAYLWKSTDYGKTWTSIVGNLPPETINVVREDAKEKDWLYVGTDLGVFVTFDGGKTLVPLNGGIPRTPVHDLVQQERDDDLVIGTHARSVWIFSMKPIRDLDKDIKAKDLHLWMVDDMTASRNWGYGFKSLWDSSPPEPPKLKLKVWAGNAGKGTVKILSKDGKSVVKQTEVTAIRGFNTFEIDLQAQPEKRGQIDLKKVVIKTGEDAIKDPFEIERAKYLTPGEYLLEVTVGDKKVTQPWKLEPPTGTSSGSVPITEGEKDRDR